MSYLLAFLGFAALIILHEAGHFAAAKAVGMRVERFSLFFGPMLVKRRRGETEYGIGPIPLGGYVKITGMNPHEELPAEVRPRAYYNQPVWKRVVVIGAGPAVNILLAFLIVWGLLFFGGESVTSKRVDTVEKGTPAAAILHPGDQLVSVDGVTGSVDRLHDQLASHKCAGQQVNGCQAAVSATLQVRRAGRLVTFSVRPRYVAADKRAEVGFAFGVTQQPVGAVKAASLSVTGLWNVTTDTVSRLARLFEPKVRAQVHGVVGGFKQTQQSFAKSATTALWVLALISLSLGVINLFPFLPLDGGHLFWALAEKVRGRAIRFEILERASVVGFALILMLFVIGFTNDISTLTGHGFTTP